MKFFKKANKSQNIQEEWNQKGATYAKGINEMVAYGEEFGWENWQEKEPEDHREHLADDVLNLLIDANKNGNTIEFRKNFPPSHGPFIKFYKEKGQSIEQLQFIDKDKIIFLTGTSYQKRQAYILNNQEIIELDSSIHAIGKSKINNIFAIANGNQIVTTNGWQGEIIESFNLDATKELGITELIPFNNGLKVLLVSSEGIYLIDKKDEKMIHPEPDLEDEEWTSYIDMENATLSHDNNYIVVGDQCSDHRILDSDGNFLGKIGPQSSYPHFCSFSKDDTQLITNTCHFYNGLTIGVKTSEVQGMDIEAWKESDRYITIDDGMRVYHGIATSQTYILGDAYGYIRAIDKNGHCVWRHFVGSTISGITVSDDEKTLWVASCAGIIHKLQLGKGHRDKHTIGNGNHYEDFRILIWKDQEILKW